mgnify:CR=1 FL=1
MKNYFLLFVMAISGLACMNVLVPTEPRPTPVVVDTDLCDAAEANLLSHGCEEGKPTKRGTRFSDVCRELHASGIYVNPRCLATLNDCSKVDVCTNTSKERR